MNKHVYIRNNSGDWFKDIGFGTAGHRRDAHPWKREDAERFLKAWPNERLIIVEIDTVESLRAELAKAREVLTECDKAADGLRSRVTLLEGVRDYWRHRSIESENREAAARAGEESAARFALEALNFAFKRGA